MKLLLLLSLATFACSARIYIDRPVYFLEIFRQRTLADDFRELNALIPADRLEDLFRRYLLGDAEFQSIIRYLGSQDVYRALEQIRGQPEIQGLNLWLQQQIPLGRLENLSEEDSAEDLLLLLGRRPGLREQLKGWKGFITEFLQIYPRQEIRNLIRYKVAANGKFAEFWGRIIELRPVYERILKLPEIRKVIERLRELGVDIEQLDRLIREDLGWQIAGGGQQIGGSQLGKLPARKPEGIPAGGHAGANAGISAAGIAGEKHPGAADSRPLTA